MRKMETEEWMMDLRYRNDLWHPASESVDEGELIHLLPEIWHYTETQTQKHIKPQQNVGGTDDTIKPTPS